MIKMLKDRQCLSSEEKKEYLLMGYQYAVCGNTRKSNFIDPSSGYPYFIQDLLLFSDKKSAQEYADTQVHPFNKDLKVNVMNLNDEVPIFWTFRK